jgi:hypothetical protein
MSQILGFICNPLLRGKEGGLNTNDTGHLERILWFLATIFYPKKISYIYIRSIFSDL